MVMGMKDDRFSVPNMVLIGSTGKNSGKTYFGTKLTKRISEERKVEVLKIATVCEGATCIYGKEGCGICDKFPGGYKLEEEISSTSGKDTSLYLEAGASRAVLMKSTREAMIEGFEEFLGTVDDNSLIICESNSLGKFVKPGMFVMVQGEGDIKPSAGEVMEYADIIYENLR